MQLNLYRRHSTHCSGGRSLHETTYEGDETRLGWKSCDCPIYASGTVNRIFKRKNTERILWDEAKGVATAWETAGSWDGEVPQVVIAPEPSVDRITIERAVKAHLAEHAGVSAPNTQRKIRTILKKLTEYSESKGFVMLDQWGPIDVREFRASWAVSPLTASKNMTVVKSFFEFTVSNEWLSRSPAKLVKGVRGKGDGSNTERIPFSDDELKRMFEACDTQYGKRSIKWSREIHHQPATGVTANYKYKWSGQDLADFIAVSVYTGLRISDLATFRSERMLDTGECHIRTTKNGRKVYTWIPEWLQEQIRARAREHGSLIFGAHATSDVNVITDLWRRKLKRLWALCGPWPETPTPHRFRHTFARILLQKPNVTVRDVAELMGDTEEMIKRHYSAWVSERQERLTSVLKEAFEDKPRPRLVAIG